MTDVGIWPSQTVLPPLHRYHPITSQRNALLIGESQVGVGCWGSSFDLRLMESDCPSLWPWSWVDQVCIFQLILRPQEGRDLRPMTLPSLLCSQIFPFAFPFEGTTSASSLLSILGPCQLQPAWPLSCRALTFWFNFICHSRTIIKKGTIRTRHLARPPEAPQIANGPLRGPLWAATAFPPASLDGCPVFVFLQINLLKSRYRLQSVTQKTINNTAGFAQEKKKNNNKPQNQKRCIYIILSW